jgi:hypothetical protein
LQSRSQPPFRRAMQWLRRRPAELD